jgi:hypothetical protein
MECFALSNCCRIHWDWNNAVQETFQPCFVADDGSLAAMDEAVHRFAEGFLVGVVQKLEAGKAYRLAVLAVLAAAKVGTAVEVAGSLVEAVLGDAGEEILAVAA